MLGKRTRPGKLPDSFMSGGRTGYPEAITSPKCSLEFRIVSPRSLKNSDPIRGVGLGIVAALEKSSSGEKTQNTTPTRSNPIPIGVRVTKFNEDSLQEPELGGESMEESYTYVTCHRHNKSSNKGEDGGKGHDRNEVYGDIGLKSSSFFYESPPQRITEASRGEYFPKLDFLSSCYLCRKKLHGKDIYMYRGDKAFCSTECRCRQITMDEWKEKEKCGSEARSMEVSSSPYSRDNLFFTGIIAT